MNKDIIYIIIIIIMISITGCTSSSSYKDCAYTCMQYKYDCSFFGAEEELRCNNDTMTWGETKIICHDECRPITQVIYDE